MSVEFSVVIPTFRRPRLLRETLLSALGQERVTFEIIVTDDSPEGLAQAVLKEIGDPLVSYIRRPVPSGGNPSMVETKAGHGG